MRHQALSKELQVPCSSPHINSFVSQSFRYLLPALHTILARIQLDLSQGMVVMDGGDPSWSELKGKEFKEKIKGPPAELTLRCDNIVFAWLAPYQILLILS